jgi:ABC-type multidrug transport system fused ATPase/permease subunit
MVFGVISAILVLYNNPAMSEIIDSPDFKEHKFKFMAGYLTVMILFFAVLCALVYGVYSLIYGILLKRLNKNYQELKRLEV